MIIQEVNRTDPEKIYMIVHNTEATSITRGQGVAFVGGAAAQVSNDGISAVRATANADLMRFAGIANRDIPADGYGLVQIWGYVDSIMFSHRASNTTIGFDPNVAHSYLIPSATKAGAFTSTAPQDALSVVGVGGGAMIQAWDTVVLSLSLHSAGGHVWGKGFVRGF